MSVKGNAQRKTVGWLRSEIAFGKLTGRPGFLFELYFWAMSLVGRIGEQSVNEGESDKGGSVGAVGPF